MRGRGGAEMFGLVNVARASRLGVWRTVASVRHTLWLQWQVRSAN